MIRCFRLLLLLAGTIFVSVSHSAANDNNSLRFDGVDDRLQVGVFPAITGPFTVEAWVKPGTQGGGINPRIVELVGSNDTSFRLALGGNQAGILERHVSLELGPATLSPLAHRHEKKDGGPEDKYARGRWDGSGRDMGPQKPIP